MEPVYKIEITEKDIYGVFHIEAITECAQYDTVFGIVPKGAEFLGLDLKWEKNYLLDKIIRFYKKLLRTVNSVYGPSIKHIPGYVFGKFEIPADGTIYLEPTTLQPTIAKDLEESYLTLLPVDYDSKLYNLHIYSMQNGQVLLSYDKKFKFLSNKEYKDLLSLIRD